jgi:hypothetical protein
MHLKKIAETSTLDIVFNLDIFNDPSDSWLATKASELVNKGIVTKDMLDMPSGEFADVIFSKYLNNDAGYDKIKNEVINQCEDADSNNSLLVNDALFDLESSIANEIQDICVDIFE